MKPTTKEGSLGGVDIQHPAFGSISVNRVNCGHGSNTRLHGSDFSHQRYVSIQIHEAEIARTDSYDRHHQRGRLVEVALSEAQWATFVSSFGQGSGTPCTLTWVRGDGFVPPIEMDIQTEHLKDMTLNRVKELLAPINRMYQVLDDQKMTNKAKAALKKEIDKMKLEVQHNLPYFLESFEEHMENTTEKAKSEVHAYINTKIMEAGFTALTDGNELLKIAE